MGIPPAEVTWANQTTVSKRLYGRKGPTKSCKFSLEIECDLSVILWHRMFLPQFHHGHLNKYTGGLVSIHFTTVNNSSVQLGKYPFLNVLHVLFPLDGESFWPRNSTKMWKYFTHRETLTYVDVLSEILIYLFQNGFNLVYVVCLNDFL
jgi:hypothetical protein